MARVCEVTGKKTQVGNNVSHANNKTKRCFNINLHNKRFWLESQKRFDRIKVSSKGLKTIDKYGIEKVLKDLSKHQDEIKR